MKETRYVSFAPFKSYLLWEVFFQDNYLLKELC